MSSLTPNAYDIHSATMENVFIGISGLIGAGKSTLATALAKQLNLPVYYEPVQDNEYLADFYGDIAKYAFPMQVYLLNKRFKQQQVIVWTGKGGVQDRTIYEDSIFAKMLRDSGLMNPRDYQTYVDLFQHMSNFMRKPNIIVHLDVSPEESMRRIKMRNRGCESGISLEYLKNLHTAYEDFIRDISKIIPVIKVDYEKFRTAEEMATAIAEKYHAMTNITNVTFDKESPTKTTESKSVAETTTPTDTTQETTEEEQPAPAEAPSSNSSDAPVADATNTKKQPLTAEDSLVGINASVEA